MEHVPGAPCDSNIPRPDCLEREQRRFAQVSQLEALGPVCRHSIGGGVTLFAPELGDGARDGLVQAFVQQTKVFCADRRVQLHSQLSDRLTDVAVGVNDLRNGKPRPEDPVREPGGLLAQTVEHLLKAADLFAIESPVPVSPRLHRTPIVLKGSSGECVVDARRSIREVADVGSHVWRLRAPFVDNRDVSPPM